MPPRPPHIWTYRIVTDTGVAPNIANGILTLTLCKPIVRQGAKVGDYVLALVAVGARTPAQKANNTANGYKFRAAYLFRVDEIVKMAEYEAWCSIHASDKRCRRPELGEGEFFGDCQYGPGLEYILGPHGEGEKERNISGKHSLVSRTYASWTSPNAMVLTQPVMESMGINYAQALGAARGQFKTPLTPANIAVINGLIASGPKPSVWGEPAPRPASAEGAGAEGGRRKTRKTKTKSKSRSHKK